MSSQITPTDDVENPPGQSLLGLLIVAGVLLIALIPDAPIVRPKVTWARAAVLSAAAIALLFQALHGRLRFSWPTWLAFAVVPALLAALHPLHTAVASESLASDEIQRLALIPLSTWAASYALHSSLWRRRFVLGLAVAGLIVGGHAMLQRLGGMFPGELLNTLHIYPSSRALAGFGNPVFLGAWLVLVTPVLIAEALTSPRASRWLASLAAGLCLPALLATSSVGSRFGMGLALLTALWLLLPTRRSRIWMAALVIGSGAAIVLIDPGAIFRERVHTLIWRDSWELFQSHPGGVGPGQFPVAFLPFASDELLAAHPMGSVIINDAHNEPLQVLVELGWPALLSVLLAAGYGWAFVRERLAEPWASMHEKTLFVAAVAGIGGMLGQSLVSPDLRFHVSVIMLGIMLGFLTTQSPQLVLSLRGGRLGRGLLSILALGCLALVVHDTWNRSQLGELLQPGSADELLPLDMEALEELRAATQAAPEDPNTWYQLGASFYESKRFADAAEAFRRTLELTPDNVPLIRILGVCETATGQYEAAVKHLRRSLAENPDELEIRYYLAFASFGRGDLRTALMETELVLRADPEHVEARALLEQLRE